MTMSAQFHDAISISGLMPILADLKNHKDASLRKNALEAYMSVLETGNFKGMLDQWY